MFILCLPFSGSAQLNDSHKYLSLLADQVYLDTLHSSNPISKNNNLVGPGIEVVVGTIVNKKVPIEIIPAAGFKGKTYFSLQYTEGFKPYYITYVIEYNASSVVCEDDFIVLSSDETISILPLINDYASSGGMVLAGVANSSGGMVSYSNDTIFFTPDSLVKKGFVLYSVKDSLGATSNGLIHLLRENPFDSDTLFLNFSLPDTKRQYIYLPGDDFSIDISPTKGSLINKSPLCYQYIPVSNASGSDIFYFTNSDEKVVCIRINITNTIKNRSSVRDDYYYTPKNTSITFNVFDNDLSSNFPINQFSSGLVPTAGVKGEFTYNPPSGFKGVKNFTYRVNYGGWNYTGKIIIGVGNYEPQQDLTYEFKTLKNTPLVLPYEVPVTGYDFGILDFPQFGTVQTRYDDFAFNCNDTFFTQKVYIEYIPDNEFYGKDSFDISYSVINGDSFVYKIYIEVINPDENILCPCVTPDCVKQGDFNTDGRVSVSDVIPLARFMGYAGPEREDHAHSGDIGTYSENWGILQPSGSDIKHIDGTGDGLIALSDTSSVASNYGSVYTLVPREVLGVKDYPFSFKTNQTSYEPGDLIMIDFLMGTSQKPALNVFGLAFGLEMQQGIIDSASINVTFEKDSWFNYTSPSVNFWRQPKKGKLDIAHAVTGGIVVDELEGFIPKGNGGFGKLGAITGIVVDELEGFKGTKLQSASKIKTIYTNGIEIEDIYGKRFMIPDTFIQIKIETRGTQPDPTEDKLLVFPNPASDILNLHFNGRNLIFGLKVFNSRGQIIQQIPQVMQQHISLDTHQWAPGIYVIQVQTQQGIINKKVIIH